MVQVESVLWLREILEPGNFTVLTCLMFADNFVSAMLQTGMIDVNIPPSEFRMDLLLPRSSPSSGEYSTSIFSLN